MRNRELELKRFDFIVNVRAKGSTELEEKYFLIESEYWEVEELLLNEFTPFWVDKLTRLDPSNKDEIVEAVLNVVDHIRWALSQPHGTCQVCIGNLHVEYIPKERTYPNFIIREVKE